MTEFIPPVSLSGLLEQIEHEWSALLAVIDQLSAEQMTTPDAGGWSPKDNLAHLTHWERFMRLRYLEHRPDSDAMRIDAGTLQDLDEDGINALVFERNRGRSLQDILKELLDIHAEVVAVLKEKTFEQLMEPVRPDDPEKRPTINWVIGNTSAHYAEHRTTIEKMLKG